jgi:hypothetical protein
MSSENKCEICGKTFKTPQALSGHIQFKHSEQPQDASAQTAAVATKKQSPLEQLIDELKLPVISDGQAQVFDSGVEYGVRSVLVGVRVAQELSAMGVQQAVPIIKMAQEMRESEGQAAKVIASELAGATLEGNRDLKAALQQLGSQVQTSSPNPMASMMAGVMQPVLGQAMQQMMGSFMGGAMPGVPPPAGSGQPPPSAEQGQPAAGQQAPQNPAPPQEGEPGISYHSLDELEE